MRRRVRVSGRSRDDRWPVRATSAEWFEGTVYYDGDTVQNRIANLLEDARWPESLARIFTGNVNVKATKYDPGDSILVAMRDAADAEFPGIANLYTDKLGRVCFHGRRARFDPEGTMVDTDWDFVRWPVGDTSAPGAGRRYGRR